MNISKLAKENGVSVECMLAEISAAIDFGWQSGKMKESGIFESKPTVDEFISVITNKIKE